MTPLPIKQWWTILNFYVLQVIVNKTENIENKHRFANVYKQFKNISGQ